MDLDDVIRGDKSTSYATDVPNQINSCPHEPFVVTIYGPEMHVSTHSELHSLHPKSSEPTSAGSI